MSENKKTKREQSTKAVDKDAFIRRKLAALNTKPGIKSERSAVRVINNNKGGIQ